MSQCMTCRYALYDGMCLAKGKFTALDAPACDTYAAHADVEASRLRAENRELRQLVQSLYRFSFDEYPDGTELSFADKLHELGIEVAYE